ncbi:hypothetical protein BSKO_09956 [Bryopsis sp. KO-2023]|nr:hypothetical protein BSKO_09956 [Bryopsis sp. KO-2023]
MPPYVYSDHLKVLNQFLGKSDGKDKLCATIQYACMFLSAGEAGNVKKIQASVAAARKVFRVMKPLESLTPLLLNPGFLGNRPGLIEAIGKLKSVLMAGYFSFDHLIWSGHAGLVTDTELLARIQKISSSCWFGGSLCVIICECFEILNLAAVERAEENDEDWAKEQNRVKNEIRRRSLTLTHACLQATLAIGILQLLPLKPRAVGLIGAITSALNCYMLFPSLPKRVEKTTKKD